MHLANILATSAALSLSVNASPYPRVPSEPHGHSFYFPSATLASASTATITANAQSQLSSGVTGYNQVSTGIPSIYPRQSTNDTIDWDHAFYIAATSPGSSDPNYVNGFLTVNRYKGTDQTKYQFGILSDGLPALRQELYNHEAADFYLEGGNLKFRGWETDDVTAIDSALTFKHDDEPDGDLSLTQWNGTLGWLAVNGTADNIWFVCQSNDPDYQNNFQAVVASHVDPTEKGLMCYLTKLRVIDAETFNLAQWCPHNQRAHCSGPDIIPLSVNDPNVTPTAIGGATINVATETHTWPGVNWVPTTATWWWNTDSQGNPDSTRFIAFTPTDAFATVTVSTVDASSITSTSLRPNVITSPLSSTISSMSPSAPGSSTSVTSLLTFGAPPPSVDTGNPDQITATMTKGLPTPPQTTGLSTTFSNAGASPLSKRNVYAELDANQIRQRLA